MSKLTEFRTLKDNMFRGSQSPLTPEERKMFGGLKYFDENPSLRIEAKLQKYPKPEQIQMATSTGHIAEYLKYGFVNFNVNGKPQTLQIYKSPDFDELFLPFMDETTGHETYGSGRYLDVSETGDGNVLMDFNLAYNPYCAFDPTKWSCPLPPKQNRLTVRIEAGEKKYHDD
jgi:uncharacterized protein